MNTTHKMIMPYKCDICSSDFFWTQDLLEYVSSSHQDNFETENGIMV